jgi:hypothetical protein
MWASVDARDREDPHRIDTHFPASKHSVFNSVNC